MLADKIESEQRVGGNKKSSMNRAALK